MMDGYQDNAHQVEEHDDGSCQDGRLNDVSDEITKEISPSQHERWRDLVFDIQLRAQEDVHDDFLSANGSFTPTPSPVSKRFCFSPMAIPRIGRRGGSMSPSSSGRSTTLENVFNFKNRNNNADIEQGVELVYDDGRVKSNIPRTWSLTNLLTPRKYKKTESLPVTPLAHSNAESVHKSTLPIRRTRSVPTLIDKDGNVKSLGVLRVIPTPSRGDTESLEMMHEHEDGGEDVPEEEAVCRICMVELGKDSEAFKMECMCKGELALAHKECTIKWFTIKGNITCDVCKQDVTNLPVTLLRVDDRHEDRSREAEHTEVNKWQDVPILITVSILAYFSFLEKLLLMDMKSSAVAVALPFACIIGLLGSVTSTTMVKRKYVWLFATIQFSFVVLFGHVFYSRIDAKQPVTCIVLATMVGFGLTMSATAVITVFMEWRRSHAHHHHQPASTQVVTPPFQTAEYR
ncbi:RING/U-box superfamily protein [Raphanus sativus]|nr:RING/U-box superfamily protein [Raphanus sativus]